MEEKTQWFILNKPLNEKYQINIDDEIDENRREFEKLKEKKRMGLYWHNRTRRIKSLMKILIIYRPYSDDSIIGVRVSSKDSKEKSDLQRKRLCKYLDTEGYEPVRTTEKSNLSKSKRCGNKK